jgi:hypothetical protein
VSKYKNNVLRISLTVDKNILQKFSRLLKFSALLDRFQNEIVTKKDKQFPTPENILKNFKTS